MVYKTRLISSSKVFEKLEYKWNSLLSQSPSNNYFLRWEWLWCWWQVYARIDDELSIIICEKDNEIIAITPFYIRKRLIRGVYPSRLLMYIGTQVEWQGDVGSDYLDIIYKDGSERDVVCDVFKYIVKNNLCDEICLFRINSSSSTYSLIQKEADKYRFLQNVNNEYPSPYIKLPSSWEGYLSTVTAQMRQKIRKERRQLQKFQRVVFKKAENVDELENNFRALVELHELRWKSKGVNGVFSNEKISLFHRKVLPYMLENNQLDLYVLSVDNKNVAALYNIIYANKIYFYQSGINAANSKVALGYIIHSYCIENAIDKGLSEYDFLPDAESGSYKERFTKDVRKVSDVYIACDWGVKNIMRATHLARNIYRYIKLIHKNNKN